MINCPNNILSYFIKDIKDATELAFYKQINNKNIIQILYKDQILYKINNHCYNYIKNIIKHIFLKYICKSNISYDYLNNIKTVYYKNDTKIKDTFSNSNSIKFQYTYNIYNKFLNKTRIYYCNNINCIFLTIFYSKKYKYIMINLSTTIFTSPQILIPNKYELQYYCKFFNLYFVNNWRIIGE
jgi:hypothetical protein